MCICLISYHRHSSYQHLILKCTFDTCPLLSLSSPPSNFSVPSSSRQHYSHWPPCYCHPNKFPLARQQP